MRPRRQVRARLRGLNAPENCLNASALSVAKIENTATITTAALVTTPAVALIACATASCVGSPRCTPSRMRLRMKTW